MSEMPDCHYIRISTEGTHYCALDEQAIRERDERIAELTAERDRLGARVSNLDRIHNEAFALKLMQTDPAVIAALDRIIELCGERE